MNNHIRIDNAIAKWRHFTTCRLPYYVQTVYYQSIKLPHNCI